MNEKPNTSPPTGGLPINQKITERLSIKVTPFRKDIRKTSPHRHNGYLELIYLSEGAGFHTIDFMAYLISPPILFVIRKEQVHHWDLEGVPEGFVLIVKDEFLKKSLDKSLKGLLLQVSKCNCIQLTDHSIVQRLFEILAAEYQASDASESDVMDGLLKALLAKVLQVAEPMTAVMQPNADYYQGFIELLTHTQEILNNVAHYAALLHTTPQNLNAACRRTADQSAATTLAGFIVGEAKRLLIYTDMTVSEISNTLQFKDASHFVKYFKRQTGQTPKAFRSCL